MTQLAHNYATNSFHYFSIININDVVIGWN
jgi:hypothetical protein